jgi:hypothetical protein
VNNKRIVPIVAREVDTNTVPEALRKSGTNQRWLNGCVLMSLAAARFSSGSLLESGRMPFGRTLRSGWC